MLSAVARRRLKYVVAGSAVGGGALIYYNSATPIHHEPVSTRPPPPWTPPSRHEMLNRLKEEKEEFDLLIVGGGATGAGIAVDAATRGLKVALVERDDFASGMFIPTQTQSSIQDNSCGSDSDSCHAGTSSKSTKLVHGGVRYLEKAFWELDYEQYKLVREALHERRTFLTTAPYLSHMLPIMLPIYK